MTEDLPRQLARTRRFTAGVRQQFDVAAGGRLVTYRRDGHLWSYATDEQVERDCGTAAAYHVSRSANVAVVQDDDQLHLVDLDTAERHALAVADATDARLDPTGRVVAYVRDRALHVIDADGTNKRVVCEPDGEAHSCGRAEFAAWMSMDRNAGYWWSPDGRRLIVACIDESQVAARYVPDAAEPERPPSMVRYPAVGEANADVRLLIVDLAGGSREIRWDRERFEYVVRVDWSAGDPLVAVQTRDQRTVHLLGVNPDTGDAAVLRAVTDPAWVDVAVGVPAHTASGDVVWVERDPATDTNRLMVGSAYVTPPGLQVQAVRAVDGDTVTFRAQIDPTETHVYTYDGELRRVTVESGVHDGIQIAGTTVLESRSFSGGEVTVNGHVLPARDDTPLLELRVELMTTGERHLRAAVLRPSWHEPGMGKLPVLMSPYAGPGMQLAVAARTWYYLLAQWFAEQGFIVIAADGRGTPGRGPAFAREIAGDILTPVLQDQVDVLHDVAEREGDLDLDRVAIRGWSFSGYLAAAAVLHRPETFHVAVAGAPVTDQRMYDTYWKERFLGDPKVNADAYRRCSLLPFAGRLSRPLLLIHGLADTNVWAAHTLRLSAALTAAGKPHSVLPLPGQGHRLTDPDVVAGLPHHELAFIRQASSR
jgi:dipeptidyl-peptidase 4